MTPLCETYLIRLFFYFEFLSKILEFDFHLSHTRTLISMGKVEFKMNFELWIKRETGALTSLWVLLITTRANSPRTMHKLCYILLGNLPFYVFFPLLDFQILFILL